MLLGAEDDPATVDNCDGFVDGVDGSTKSFTIMTLAAIDGIQNKIDPGDPMDKNIYHLAAEEYEKIGSAPGSGSGPWSSRRAG